MFQKSLIRKLFESKIVIWAVILALFIPFILFFHAGDIQDGRSPDAAGEVFGKRIPWKTFQEHYRWLRLWYPAEFLEQNPEMVHSLLVQETWDRIMLAHEARRAGIKVNDGEVAHFIRSTPMFQQNGQFVRSRYDGFLSYLQMTPRQFEDLIRDTQMIEKLLAAKRAETAVSEEEAREAYQKENTRYDASFVVFEPAAGGELDNVSDADIQAAYDASPPMTGTQYRFRYIRRTREEAGANVDITDEAVEESLQRREIDLESMDADAAAAERERERLRLREEAITRALVYLAIDLESETLPLDEQAQRYELEVQTLGPIEAREVWLAHDFDQLVAQTLETLQPGQISDVIETDRGIVRLELLERIEPKPEPLEEVRDEIRRRLAEQRAREEARKRAEAVREELAGMLKSGRSWEEAAAGLAEPPVRPDPFLPAQGVPGIGSVPPLAQALAAQEEGSLSPVIESPDRMFLYYLHARIPAPAEGYENQKEALRQRLLQQKQEQSFVAWLNSLRAEARVESYLEPEPQF